MNTYRDNQIETYERLQEALDQVARLKRAIPDCLTEPTLWPDRPDFYSSSHPRPVTYIFTAIMSARQNAQTKRAWIARPDTQTILQKEKEQIVEAAARKLQVWRRRADLCVQMGPVPKVYRPASTYSDYVVVSPMWLRNTERYLKGNPIVDDKFVIRMKPRCFNEDIGQQVLDVAVVVPFDRNKFKVEYGVVICHDNPGLRTYGGDYKTALKTFRSRSKRLILARMAGTKAA